MERVKIFTDTEISTISVERLLEKVYLEYVTVTTEQDSNGGFTPPSFS